MSSCNNHGDYDEGTCHCDIAWFEKNCDKNIQDEWSEAYYLYVGIFLGLFSLMALVTIRELTIQYKERSQLHYKTYQTEKLKVSGFRLLCILLQSPVNVCISMCFLFCAIKIIWLAIDPFQLEGLFMSRVWERLLAEVVYSILFAIYGILLIVWYSLYDEVSFNTKENPNDRKCIWGMFKCSMKFRILLVFVLQIGISILKGLRLSQSYRQYFYAAYSILYLNFVLFIIEFSVYGIALYQCIDGQLKRNLEQLNRENVGVLNGYMEALRNVNIRESGESSCKNSEFAQAKTPSYYARQTDARRSQETTHLPMRVNFNEVEAQTSNARIRSCTGAVKRQESIPASIQQMNTEGNSNNEFEPEIIQVGPNTEPTSAQPSNHNNAASKSFHIEDVEEFRWEDEVRRQHERKVLQERQMIMIKRLKDEIISKTKKSKQNDSRSYVRQDIQIFQEEKKIIAEEVKHYVQAQFQNKRENLNLDKRILRQILLLITLGVILEVAFAVFSIIFYASTLLQDAVGVLVFLYVDSTLELLSLCVVLKLFQDIKSKELDNLIWIRKIGHKNNRINQKFQFDIPEQLKQEDEKKIQFQERINRL